MSISSIIQSQSWSPAGNPDHVGLGRRDVDVRRHPRPGSGWNFVEHHVGHVGTFMR
jgi:hypothetical protein